MKIREYGVVIFLSCGSLALLSMTTQMLNIDIKNILMWLPAIMSALAASLSAYAAVNTHKINVMKDSCNLSINRINHGEEGYELSIVNKGPGQAILEHATITIGSVDADISNNQQVRELAQILVFETGYDLKYHFVGMPFVIMKGEKIPLLIFTRDNVSKTQTHTKSQNRDDTLERIRMKVTYADIYGNQKSM